MSVKESNLQWLPSPTLRPHLEASPELWERAMVSWPGAYHQGQRIPSTPLTRLKTAGLGQTRGEHGTSNPTPSGPPERGCSLRWEEGPRVTHLTPHYTASEQGYQGHSTAFFDYLSKVETSRPFPKQLPKVHMELRVTTEAGQDMWPLSSRKHPPCSSFSSQKKRLPASLVKYHLLREASSDHTVLKWLQAPLPQVSPVYRLPDTNYPVWHISASVC